MAYTVMADMTMACIVIGLFSYRLCSYAPYRHGLYTHGLRSYGLFCHAYIIYIGHKYMEAITTWVILPPSQNSCRWGSTDPTFFEKSTKRSRIGFFEVRAFRRYAVCLVWTISHQSTFASQSSTLVDKMTRIRGFH